MVWAVSAVGDGWQGYRRRSTRKTAALHNDAHCKEHGRATFAWAPAYSMSAGPRLTATPLTPPPPPLHLARTGATVGSRCPLVPPSRFIALMSELLPAFWAPTTHRSPLHRCVCECMCLEAGRTSVQSVMASAGGRQHCVMHVMPSQAVPAR
eukprot:365812-Chlamydomonas_euryale.AAC.9